MNKLLFAIVAAILLAFACIAVLGGAMANVYWLGEFFLKSLKMIVVPLVMLSVIAGIAQLGDIRKLGRLGGRTVIFYLLTTLAAVITGSLLVNLIRPGNGIDTAGAEALEKLETMGEKSSLDVFSDIMLSFVSDNIFASMVEMQMLPIIVFSLLFGAVLSTLGSRGEPLLRVCLAGNDAMMKLVHWIMFVAPVGIFGLVAGKFGREIAEHGPERFYDILNSLALYMGTVIGGLAVHAFVTLPLLLGLLGRRNPLHYARGMASALLTAFSTASSSATLPITLEALEERNRVDPRAAQFVAPLGATLNMDGTALYEAVAAIFIAQAFGVELTILQQIIIVITATLAAVGAAGIPEAGLFTLVIVLQAVGLPLEGASLIVAVDWLLDRFRTTVNVWGDSVGAAVMERIGLQD